MEDKKEKTGQEKVVNAAIDEFSENGFAGARVDRIAKTSGLNKAMIYYYFSSKEKLYDAVLSIIYKRVSEDVSRQINSEGDAIERLDKLIDMYADIILSLDEKLLRIMMKEVSSGGKFLRKLFIPIIIPLQKNLLSIIDQSVGEGKIREGYHAHTLFQIVGSVVFFGILKIATRGTELEGLLMPDNYKAVFKETLKNNFIEGLKPRE